MPQKRLQARVKKDGSVSDEPIWYYPNDPATGRPFEGEDGRPGVGIRLRHVPASEYRRIVQEHTTRSFDETVKVWIEKVDNAAVGDAVCLAAVQGWYGIEAADGGDLPCVPETVLYALDIVGRSEVQYLATRALTPIEVAARAASFREPAGVRDVVEGMEQKHAMLPAGDSGGAGVGVV